MDAQVLSRGEDGSVGMADGITLHALPDVEHVMFCRVGQKFGMVGDDCIVSRWLVADIKQPCKIYIKDGVVLVSTADIYP